MISAEISPFESKTPQHKSQQSGRTRRLKVAPAGAACEVHGPPRNQDVQRMRGWEKKIKKKKQRKLT